MVKAILLWNVFYFQAQPKICPRTQSSFARAESVSWLGEEEVMEDSDEKVGDVVEERTGERQTGEVQAPLVTEIASAINCCDLHLSSSER